MVVDRNEPHWYVAYVQSCLERKAAEVISRRGFECFVPTIREMHQWSDRKKLVERLLLPRIVFIRTSEADHVKAVKDLSYVYSYISVRGAGHPAIIPDKEMNTFRAMVERGGRHLAVHQEPLAKGDKVKVVSGPLVGLECELVAVDGERVLAVSLGALGTATMDLCADDVEKIQ